MSKPRTPEQIAEILWQACYAAIQEGINVGLTKEQSAIAVAEIMNKAKWQFAQKPESSDEACVDNDALVALEQQPPTT